MRLKPVVIDYNQHMLAVGKLDLSSTTAFSMQWRKVFFSMFDVAVIYLYISYKTMS